MEVAVVPMELLPLVLLSGGTGGLNTGETATSSGGGNGAESTGSGGGGDGQSRWQGGFGGSGIFIIAYPS